jgi:hypothetical protein
MLAQGRRGQGRIFEPARMTQISPPARSIARENLSRAWWDWTYAEL